MAEQQQQLLDVPVSSRTGVPLHKTAMAFVTSDDPTMVEIGMKFPRRVMALLFLQFTAVAFIVSPFCLIDSIQHLVQSPYILFPLNVVSFIGLFLSVLAVAMRGHEEWAVRTGLFGGTFCFAVALGAKLALVPWSNYALVAIGQATASFAMLQAFYQFDVVVQNRTTYLKYHVGFLILLAIACLWILLMRESGCPWLVSIAVPLGGWLFAVNIMVNVRKACHHREPNDHIRAAIFILGPPIPDFMLFKRHSARGRWAALRAQVHLHGVMANVRQQQRQQQQQDEEEKGGLTTLQNANEYGAVDSAV